MQPITASLRTDDQRRPDAEFLVRGMVYRLHNPGPRTVVFLLRSAMTDRPNPGTRDAPVRTILMACLDRGPRRQLMDRMVDPRDPLNPDDLCQPLLDALTLWWGHALTDNLLGKAP